MSEYHHGALLGDDSALKRINSIVAGRIEPVQSGTYGMAGSAFDVLLGAVNQARAEGHTIVLTTNREVQVAVGGDVNAEAVHALTCYRLKLEAEMAEDGRTWSSEAAAILIDICWAFGIPNDVANLIVGPRAVAALEE